MSRFRQDEQYEYDEYGKFGGTGKKKHYSNPQKDKQSKLEKITKALATGAAAVIIVTGGIAASDSNLSDQIKQETAKKPVSQNTVAPKDLVHSAHSWDNGKIKLKPTCTEDGIMLFSCTGCKETREEIIPATGHTPAVSDDTVEATCTEGGHTAKTVCETCGAVLEEAHDTEALGHDWGEEVIEKAATCTADGLTTITCARCGETQSTVIPATGHIDRNEDYKCDICKKPTVTLSISKVTHEIESDCVAVVYKLSGKIKGGEISVEPLQSYGSYEYSEISSNNTFTIWYYLYGFQDFAPDEAASLTDVYEFNIIVHRWVADEEYVIINKTTRINWSYAAHLGNKKVGVKLY